MIAAAAAMYWRVHLWPERSSQCGEGYAVAWKPCSATRFASVWIDTGVRLIYGSSKSSGHVGLPCLVLILRVPQSRFAALARGSVLALRRFP